MEEAHYVSIGKLDRDRLLMGAETVAWRVRIPSNCFRVLVSSVALVSGGVRATSQTPPWKSQRLRRQKLGT